MKPLPYTVGIELTAIAQLLPNPATEHMDGGAGLSWARLVKSELEARKIKFHECHHDHHCTEVSSPILKTWEQLELFYHRVSEVFAKYHHAPKHEDAVCGGGHIHIGGLTPWQRAKVCRLACAQPWLNWLFLEPDDSESSYTFQREFAMYEGGRLIKGKRGVLTGKRSELEVCQQHERKFLDTMYRPCPCCFDEETLLTDRDTLVAPDSDFKTVEFRLFEAPLSWDEQRLHVEFALAFVNHAIKLPDKWVPAPADEARLESFGIDKCKQQMESLFKELRLETKPYNVFFQRNLDVRLSQKLELV